MTDTSGMMLWGGRALYAVLALVCIYLPLLPVDPGLRGVVLPDLFFLLSAAWVIRRPDTAPFWLIAIMAFIGDMMLNRPPGLWAFCLLAATEAIRMRAFDQHERMFLQEWIAATLVFGAALAVFHLILFVTLVPVPSNGWTMRLFLVTVISYPIAVLVLHWVVRIRFPEPAKRGRSFGAMS